MDYTDIDWLDFPQASVVPYLIKVGSHSVNITEGVSTVAVKNPQGDWWYATSSIPRLLALKRCAKLIDSYIASKTNYFFYQSMRRR